MREVSDAKSWIFNRLIMPVSYDQDMKRRELVLNAVLCTLLLLSLIALLMPLTNLLLNDNPHNMSSILSSSVFCLAISGLLLLSRKGQPSMAALILVTILSILVTELTILWSFELPIAELLYALTIVTAGVLLRTRAALLTSVFISLSVFIVSFLQVKRILYARTDWADQPFTIGDAVAYLVVFGMIGIIAWLGNREIDRSLTLARISEKAIAEQRDKLEIMVCERTKQLEAEQMARLLDIQRFAEFGKISAGLIHDVANPLTAIALNLDLMQNTSQGTLLKTARQNLKYLERYLDGARKQIDTGGAVADFSINDELAQVIAMLQHQARQASVLLRFRADAPIYLRGDPVKFSRIAANLISNSIEAYDNLDIDKAKQVVNVSVRRSAKAVILRITDNGIGIAKPQINQIFNSFYSSKPPEQRNLGLGLSLVKEYVETDFKGSVTVKSNSSGTTFTAKLYDAA